MKVLQRFTACVLACVIFVGTTIYVQGLSTEPEAYTAGNHAGDFDGQTGNGGDEAAQGANLGGLDLLYPDTEGDGQPGADENDGAGDGQDTGELPEDTSGQEAGSEGGKLGTGVTMDEGSGNDDTGAEGSDGTEGDENSEDTEDGEQLSFTVQFMLAEDDIYETQVVLENDKVAEPAAPAQLPAGMNSFIGWCLEDGTAYDFEAPVVGDLTLYASFSANYLVRFMVDGVVVESVPVAGGDTVGKPAYIPAAPDGQRFMYWYDAEGDQDTEFDFANTPIDRNLVLAPCFSGSYMVYFVSYGTPVDNQIIPANETAVEPAEPTRSGYGFLYWTADPDTEQEFTFDTPIEQDTYLYGVWAGQMVDYKVVYWVEKPNLQDFDKYANNSSDYTYAYSEIRQAEAGSTVTIDESNVVDATAVAGLKYSEYYRGGSASISGYGTTTINVFFTLIEYEILFDLTPPFEFLVATMIVNGQAYVHGESTYSIKMKYQQDIKDLWPKNQPGSGTDELICEHAESGFRRYFYAWFSPEIPGIYDGAWISHRYTAEEDMLPEDWQNIRSYTLKANWGGEMEILYLRVMMEPLDQSPEANADSVNLNGVYYRENEAYSQYANNGGTLYSLKEIMGMVGQRSNWVGKNGNDIDGSHIGGIYEDESGVPHQYLFYRRAEYMLTINAMGGTDPQGNGYETQTYRYEETIEKPAEPVREGYKFKGWYMDAEFVEPFDFVNSTMPARDMELFALWEPTQISVIFYDNVGGNELGRVGAELGGVVSGPPAEYNWALNENVGDLGAFTGWYYFVGGSLIPYRWYAEIYQETKIYAGWQLEGYTITYDTNGGTGATIVDDAEYARNVLAPVMDGSALTRGWDRFIGWQVDGVGQTYYRGNAIAMVNNVNLVARYTEPGKEYVEVFYHANGGEGQDVIITLEKGSTLLLAGDSLFAKEGYDLVAWTEDIVTHTPQYMLNTEYPDAVVAELHLYAVWQPKTYTVTFEAGANGRLNAEPDELVIRDIEYDSPWMNSWVPEAVPDDGYYFLGWAEEHPDFITRDWVLTALFVKKTEITLVANSASKTYDGTPLADSGYTLDGVLVGDDWLESVAVAGTITNAGTADNVVQGYTVQRSVSGVQHDVTHEYSVTTQKGTLAVTPVEVTITVDDVTKVYGEADPAFTGTVTELVEGDALGEVTYHREAADMNKENVVDDITLTASYTKNNNYNVTIVKAKLDITPAEATITVDDKVKYFGEDDPEFTGTITGLLGDDSLGEVTYRRADGDEHEENAGSIITLIAECLPNDNYTIAVVEGTLTILPAQQGALWVAADDIDKIYDGRQYSVNAASNIGGATILYMDENGEFTLTQSPAYTNAGSYTVQFQASHANYSTATGYATITIRKAPVTIAVDSKTKNYGEADPAFTGRVSGLVEDGDLGQVTYGRAVEDAALENAGDSIALVAEYTPNSNYEVTVQEGTLTINKLVLVVTADSYTIYEGDPAPEFTYTITGFLAGEDESSLESAPVLTSTYVAGAAAGNYPIAIRQTLELRNYTVQYEQGLLTVLEKIPATTSSSSSTTTSSSSTPTTSSSSTTTSSSSLVQSSSSEVESSEPQTESSSSVSSAVIPGSSSSGSSSSASSSSSSRASSSSPSSSSSGSSSAPTTSEITPPGGGNEEGPGPDDSSDPRSFIDGGEAAESGTVPEGVRPRDYIVVNEEGGYGAPGDEYYIEPNGTVTILDEEAPLGGFASIGGWSLFNLLLSVLALLSGVVITANGLAKRGKHKDEDEQRADEIEADAENQEANSAQRKRRARAIWLALASVTGILPVVFFLILERLDSIMIMFSQYTPLIIALFLLHMVALVIQVISRKRPNEKHTEDEDAAGTMA